MSNNTIKVSDFIAQYLVKRYGIQHVFMISGGGSMHLNDSFGRQQGLTYICNHHEQACAIAAEGYSKINQELSVVNVTTGPGGLNCLNGVFGQWTDSVPVLYISGQAKFETTINSYPNIALRQLGDQEVDIISCVKHITKYAKMVIKPNEIKYHIDKAIYLSTSGRKGPVWLDIPINVQSAIINKENLIKYDSSKDECNLKINNSQINQIVKKLKESKRPLIIAGNGIHLSKSEKIFNQFLKKYKIPIVTSLNGVDTIETDHPCFIGRIGTIGNRAGNFALQNADCILCLGTRNNIRQVSYNWENFAHRAYKIIVDIDKAELQKPTIKPDIALNIDLGDFLPILFKKIDSVERLDWLNWCLERKKIYSFESVPEYKQGLDIINPYYFVNMLTKQMNDADILVTSNGSACIMAYQVGEFKYGQRVIWNSGDASMGYELPAAIGACLASNKNVICLAGDGSIMMNLQELQTIKHHNLPIKIFILNNDGYVSIKQTQKSFFNGRLTGSEKSSGVSMPDFIKVGKAFGIKTVKIDSENHILKNINEIFKIKQPVLCEVIVDPNQAFTPKLSSKKMPDGSMVSKPLEDMYPFLNREELEKNMLLE